MYRVVLARNFAQLHLVVAGLGEWSPAYWLGITKWMRQRLETFMSESGDWGVAVTGAVIAIFEDCGSTVTGAVMAIFAFWPASGLWFVPKMLAAMRRKPLLEVCSGRHRPRSRRSAWGVAAQLHVSPENTTSYLGSSVAMALGLPRMASKRPISVAVNFS